MNVLSDLPISCNSTWEQTISATPNIKDPLLSDLLIHSNTLSPLFYKNLVLDDDQENQKANLTTLSDYISQNNPPYKLLEEELMKAMLEDCKAVNESGRNGLQVFMTKLMQLYVSSREYELNPTIPRVILKTLAILKNRFRRFFNQDVKAVGHAYWTKLESSHIKPFWHTFQITDEVDLKDLIPTINGLRSQNKLSEVVSYICTLSLHKLFDVADLIHVFVKTHKPREAAVLVLDDFELQKLFIHEMCENQNGSRAADFLKDFKRKPHDFPELIEVLNQNSLRFHAYNDHWMKVEEKFSDLKNMLGYFAQNLIDQEQYDQALSIIKRNNLLELGHIKRQDVKEKVLPYFANPTEKSFTYIENVLFTEDDYVPTEEILNKESQGVSFAKLKDFGINPESDIIWVDGCQEDVFAQACSNILDAEIVGLDSEYRFNVNKFENGETSILQIATTSKIYVFDLLKLVNSPEYKAFIRELLAKEGLLKIGHTIQSDLKFAKDDSAIVLNDCIDIPMMFKTLYPDTRQTKLSFICENILTRLDVNISKCEQLSEWNCRPLRKAQLHYAAMDAYILLVVYQKLKDLLAAQGKIFCDFVKEISGLPQAGIKKMKKTKVNKEEQIEVSELKMAE